jgi:hypothetical protein
MKANIWYQCSSCIFLYPSTPYFDFPFSLNRTSLSCLSFPLLPTPCLERFARAGQRLVSASGTTNIFLGFQILVREYLARTFIEALSRSAPTYSAGFVLYCSFAFIFPPFILLLLYLFVIYLGSGFIWSAPYPSLPTLIHAGLCFSSTSVFIVYGAPRGCFNLQLFCRYLITLLFHEIILVCRRFGLLRYLVLNIKIKSWGETTWNSKDGCHGWGRTCCFLLLHRRWEKKKTGFFETSVTAVLTLTRTLLLRSSEL